MASAELVQLFAVSLDHLGKGKGGVGKLNVRTHWLSSSCRRLQGRVPADALQYRFGSQGGGHDGDSHRVCPNVSKRQRGVKWDSLADITSVAPKVKVLLGSVCHGCRAGRECSKQRVDEVGCRDQVHLPE